MNQLESDFAEYFEQYGREKSGYEQLSAYILGMCQTYKQRNPNSIRVVFSRQPIVKEWSSIVGKINRKRALRPDYKYGDLTDLIGMTVLCAFESDKRAFLDWLRKAFVVCEEVPIDNKETGHRGVHCTIELHGASYGANPHWFRKKCEIQIKTLLEEAFDAKSHDLAYKPGHREVSESVKAQFAQFSAVLRAVDSQSEFLKSLITAEEAQFEIRRQACVSLYLAMVNDLIVATGVDPTKNNTTPQDLVKLFAEIQRLGAERVDLQLCRYTALCALECQDELFKQQTFAFCESFLKTAASDSNAYHGVATLEWALGDFESAITHVAKAIDYSIRSGQIDDIDGAKSTFVYLVTDWMAMRRTSKTEWFNTATIYKAELESQPKPDIMDTLGFYEVVFGKSREDVEKGRAILRESHRQAPERFRAFYEYHDYVALKRLMEMPYSRGNASSEGAYAKNEV